MILCIKWSKLSTSLLQLKAPLAITLCRIQKPVFSPLLHQFNPTITPSPLLFPNIHSFFLQYSLHISRRNSKCEGPWGLQTALQPQIQQYTALRCHTLRALPFPGTGNGKKSLAAFAFPSASLLVEDPGTGIPAAGSRAPHLLRSQHKARPSGFAGQLQGAQS